jgi:NADP-dependent 3-hydroxy acid dehydrogenase YdfG
MTGRAILVTGSSRGIGRAVARVFAAGGDRVAVHHRDSAALAEQLVESLPGAGHVVVRADLADPAAVRAMVDAAAAALGGLDVLVNNAGVMLLGTIVGADPEDWRRMMATNVLGLMYMTHAAIDGMVDQGSGDIVNISSVAGRTARKGAGVYNASKWAVNAFSESLRQEVTTRGVRISLVEPGAVATELSSHITQPEAREQSRQMAESMRTLQADDVARAILYVVTQPPHVAVNEVLVRPTDQER